MVAACIKRIMQNVMTDSGVCSREIINMFLVGQVSGLVENFNIGIFSDTMNVIHVKLCIIELYLFITLSMTFTLVQGHSGFNWKFGVLF